MLTRILLVLSLTASLSAQPCIRAYRSHCSVEDPEPYGVTWASTCATPAPPWTYPDLPCAMLINGVIILAPTYTSWPGVGELFYTPGNGVYYLSWRPHASLIGLSMTVELYTPAGGSGSHSFTIIR